MTPRWAACLALSESTALAALRLFPRLEFASAAGIAWLRGPVLHPDLELALKKIPGLERFELIAGGQLRPVNSRIADRVLPRLDWQPLAEAIPAALPPAALPVELRQRLSVRLIRSGAETGAAALLTTLEDWQRFALSAPLIRLEPLRFAVMDAGAVLVAGTPLPSTPGLRLANFDGVLVPCGFAWSPAVEPAVLRQLFALNAGDVAVLAEDQTVQLIHAEQFVPAGRSAVRLTVQEGLPHD